MKPLTADNADGRTLLALRAGPMTTTELHARNGCGVAGWLIKIGYVEQADSYYRLTAAGRAACPYRNPLAAPGVIQPYNLKSETEMPRENVITRQQVLAAIVEAGQAGTTRKHLIDRFACPESNIDNHISLLNKQLPPVIFKPRTGAVCAIQFAPEEPVAVIPKKQPKTETPAVIRSEPPSPAVKALAAETLDGLGLVLGGMKAIKMPPEAFETIEIKAIADRRARLEIVLADGSDFEASVCSDGSLTLVTDDGLQDTVIEFSGPAFKKLRHFLGLFADEVA